MHYPVGRLRDDRIGFFDRHVAVNALVRYPVTQLFGHAATLPVVAAQALE